VCGIGSGEKGRDKGETDPRIGQVHSFCVFAKNGAG
jgi:hypothetical protein